MKTRRGFFGDVALGAGGLWIAIHLPACKHKDTGLSSDFAPNAFLRVTRDDRIIFTLARVEMGQGTMTSETAMIAEELGVELGDIEVEFAPADPAYKNPEYGVQTTGGSNSTRTSFEPLRKAAAMAREALIGAAAQEWGVPRGDLRVERKTLKHTKSERQASIGSFALRARDHVDDEVTLTPSDGWRILGRPLARRDAQAKVDGTAVFGADIDLPGLEVAVVIHGPFSAELVRFDGTAALAMPGVRAVFAVPSGVAVVADRYPRARKAAQAVVCEWSPVEFSTEAMFQDFAKRLDADPGDVAREEGNVEEAFKGQKVIEAEYQLPFLAHAAMEPMTATAHVQADRCDVWCPTQSTTLCALVAARVTGLSLDQIRVTQTFIGGGFGRKAYADVVEEAVAISQERKAPVRVVWSREDDLRRDRYRPASMHRVRAVMKDDRPTAWTHQIIGMLSILTDALPDLAAGSLHAPRRRDPVGTKSFTTDASVVEGGKEIPYAIDNLRVNYHVAESVVPTGIWRSVGHSFNGFVVETFIDELAESAGRDPLAFRRELLTQHPRNLAVLNLAAEKAGWGTAVANGHALGVAVHESFNSYAAVVVEASVEDGRPRVHRVVVAVDCGQVVNPDGVAAQAEGGVIFGLPALSAQAITLRAGSVEQSNFHDFSMLRMFECPSIDVHVVPSEAPPSGIGEVTVAPVAPAVANALFRLTKKRVRTLPIRV